MEALPPQVQRANADLRLTIRAMICAYINAEPGCRGQAKTHSISPHGGGPNGGKLFKLEVPTPGRGASRGLRVFVEMFCDRKLVIVVSAEMKKDRDDAT